MLLEFVKLDLEGGVLRPPFLGRLLGQGDGEAAALLAVLVGPQVLHEDVLERRLVAAFRAAVILVLGVDLPVGDVVLLDRRGIMTEVARVLLDLLMETDVTLDGERLTGRE